ncbi:alpha/beta hydrolase [soil metagenome]
MSDTETTPAAAPAAEPSRPMLPPEIASPLAPFEGAVPPRPAWFEQAIAQAPERSSTEVRGAAIETLAWGERGKPGLLLLHGKMAHADWWSFIAPFFAATHRVAALSWSGMGGSGWRESYGIDAMAEEAMAVMHATGLFESAQKPIVVAHSFGGFASVRCAELHGAQLGGVLTVDMPILSREQLEARRKTHGRGVMSQRPTKVYASLPEALARFRFAPPQACDNLFIADHIARTSLKQVPLSEGLASNGWTWRFDPRVADALPGNPARSIRNAACPIGAMWGGDSALVDAEVVAYVAGVLPAGSPQIEIPAARHHVMVDEPLAFVGALRGLFAAWPGSS